MVVTSMSVSGNTPIPNNGAVLSAGRASIGMTFNDMAEFLLSLNVTEAFNFDGGGSTTMVVKRTPGALRAQ